MSDALIAAVARGLYAQWPNQFKETRPTTMVGPSYETVWVSESWDEMSVNTPSRRLELLDAARAALAAIEAQGFRIVPVEPTGRMIADGAGVNLGKDPDLVNVACITWRAMLSAAPKITEGGA